MTTVRKDWPWWTPAAAIVLGLAFCLSVWAGVIGLAGVGARFAEAKVKEGHWSREMVFDSARQLTTGRSVSLRRD